MAHRFASAIIAACAAFILAAASFSSAADADADAQRPLSLHPDNPHYVLFRGKPTVLITSGEHYGALLNADFDYVKYLDVLAAFGFNQTRAFSGAYREVPGAFRIQGNTLAPRPEAFLAPWKRTATPGALDGLNKFDLSTWDEAYFKRVHAFVREAGKRGVVVELVLFCTMYDDALWNVSPMNPSNNVNDLGPVTRGEVYSSRNPKLTAFQESLARKLASELRDFDNVYFEICNEPYERGGLTRQWNDRVVAAIADAQRDLPADRRHLIAQGFERGKKIERLNPQVSILNFHAASPEDAARNRDLRRPLADDETGGSDPSDLRYRSEAWAFLMAGGAVFSHLDFSFTTDRPDGTAVPLPRGTPGGGGSELRRQISILKTFIESLPFTRMRPDDSVVRSLSLKDGAGRTNAMAWALVEPGRVYAVYLRGGPQVDLALELPQGPYTAEWISPLTGRVQANQSFQHPGGVRSLTSPAFTDDIALRVRRIE